jgi:hypothetical protein
MGIPKTEFATLLVVQEKSRSFSTYPPIFQSKKSEFLNQPTLFPPKN